MRNRFWEDVPYLGHREIFSPVTTRIDSELKKSKALSNYLSRSDLFAFIGGFISRYYSSFGDMEKSLFAAGITGSVSIAGKILTSYGKPKLKGMDNFICNILRYKNQLWVITGFYLKIIEIYKLIARKYKPWQINCPLST